MLFQVLECLGDKANLAAIVDVRMRVRMFGAIDQLLFGQMDQLMFTNGVLCFDRLHGGKGPTRTTLALLLDFGYLSQITPIDTCRQIVRVVSDICRG